MSTDCTHATTIIDRTGAKLCLSCGEVFFRRHARVDALIEELLAPKAKKATALDGVVVRPILANGTTSLP